MLKQVVLNAVIPALSWIISSGAYAQHSFTISGRLAKDRQGIVRVSYYTEGREVVDSAVIKDGVFLLKGQIGDPVDAKIVLNPVHTQAMTIEQYRTADQQRFYLDGADYMVKSESGIKAALITGGKLQAEYNNLQVLHKPLDEQMRALAEQMERFKAALNDTGMQRIQAEAKPLGAKGKAIDSVFIAGHPDSYLAFELFRKKIRGFIDPPVVEPAFLRFSKDLRNSEEGKKLATRIDKAKRLAVGQPAIDFTLKDTLGQPVSLSSLKGKYVLLCFWQRNIMGLSSNINSLSRVNRLFKDRNLAILAVYYNMDKGYWMEAIRENNMNWINVSDEDGIDNKDIAISAVAQAYDLSYGNIPQCLLLGPDGKILARNLRMNNELPRVIEKAMAVIDSGAQAVGAREADVYVGGDMLDYPKVEWLKGAPVTQFEKERIYIVELWATWCVPCVAAMPHLNALSQKFGEKIRFIGQDVMEDDKKKVEMFVQQKGDGLTYRIAFAGGKGSDFDKKWIGPAGVTGIPQTFVIQHNKLVWQTHPDKLNEAVLQLLVDGKFTIEAAEAMSGKD